MATAEESKLKNIEAMGEVLGEQFSALWQEVVNLYLIWNEYVALFGTKPSRVDLLNQAAGGTFWVIENALWENTLLNIARLTDPPNSFGKKDKANLTIQTLPSLVNKEWQQEIVGLVNVAIEKSTFCRDWRNRYLAHRDLDLALEKAACPLAAGSRADVRESLSALVRVLNSVQGHYMDAETHYDVDIGPGGAGCLLQTIYDGLECAKERELRLEKGEFTADDVKRWNVDL